GAAPVSLNQGRKTTGGAEAAGGDRDAAPIANAAPHRARCGSVEPHIQRSWISGEAERGPHRRRDAVDGHERRRPAEVTEHHPGQFPLRPHVSSFELRVSSRELPELRPRNPKLEARNFFYLPDSDFACPPRRTLTTSAIIDSAISSGVSVPMSSPIGA